MTRLRVRVTPRAARDRIDGPGVDEVGHRYLAVRVRAAPQDGEANAAVEALVARALGAPRSAVRVVAGGKSRLKTLEIEGGPEAEAKLGDLMRDAR